MRQGALPAGDEERALLDPGALEVHAGDTLLIVATMDGTVHCVDGISGKLMWSFNSGGKLISSSSLDVLAARQAEIAKRRIVRINPPVRAESTRVPPIGRSRA